MTAHRLQSHFIWAVPTPAKSTHVRLVRIQARDLVLGSKPPEGMSVQFIGTMFHTLSSRGIRCVFIARLQASMVAAQRVDACHLLVGIIAEDWGNELSEPFVDFATDPGFKITAEAVAVVPHHHFFELHTAQQLMRVLAVPPQSPSDPTPMTSDLPVAPEVLRVFRRAEDLKSELKHERAEPLHLLAAILLESVEPVARILNEAGITSDGVMKVLQ